MTHIKHTNIFHNACSGAGLAKCKIHKNYVNTLAFLGVLLEQISQQGEDIVLVSDMGFLPLISQIFLKGNDLYKNMTGDSDVHVR